MFDLEKITEEVRKIAVAAGEFIREERKNFHKESVQEKNSHDYVSYVDKESERRIVKCLAGLIPGAEFIAEEGSGNFVGEVREGFIKEKPNDFVREEGSNLSGKEPENFVNKSLESFFSKEAERFAGEVSNGFAGEEYCWLVDPLDGTTNFIHDNAPYCVSIALRNHEELLVGVVYEICRNECFWAWKGSKAYLDGKEIHVSEVKNLDNAFIALGFPYAADLCKHRILNFIDRLYGNVAGLRLQGAAAAELCYIAAGRFDGRIEMKLGPWDIAAGTLILTQAGGKVTDFEGKNTFYSGHQVLASNGKIHEDLLDIVGK